MSCQNLLHVFATAAHPLVLFLDDLQWADQASLQLLRSLLTDPDLGHLLAIGAYRDNEVTPGDALSLTLNALRDAGVTVTEAVLPPLPAEAVAALVADALQTAQPEVAPLAALVSEKTQGNPFFISQFLTSLHHEKLLRFDADGGRWQWELERCRSAMVTDNVLDFMLDKLQRLGAATQEVLKLAACIGFEFDLRTLTTISGRTAEYQLAPAARKLRARPVEPRARGRPCAPARGVQRARPGRIAYALQRVGKSHK